MHTMYKECRTEKYLTLICNVCFCLFFCLFLFFFFFFFAFSDQLRNSYQIGYDGSLRILYASGLDSHYQTEPHVLAGTANPTVAKRNMTLPGENGQNLVEWRFRKEQAQGKVNVFGRKLRVSMQAGMGGVYCILT